MIARLRGTLLERSVLTNIPRVIIECGGVGYDVVVSTYTLGSLPAINEEVTLRIFTHTSRDAEITLFGFHDLQERQLFDHLITVKNVGPSTAMTMLSGSTPRDLVMLIANRDEKGLLRIKGVGKKTAELTVVELHERAAQLLLSWDASGGLRPVAMPSSTIRTMKSSRHPMIDEVANALVGLGWRPQEADQAVVDLPVPPDATIEGLLRQALRSMPR
jgi:Holliday junction DNA helicase RuvA